MKASKILIVPIFVLMECFALESYAETTLCDIMAAHPDDPDRTAQGVERGYIDLEQAEAACRDVLREYPEHARTNHQLGRVLYYQGREEEALKYLQSAADKGYSEAIFVLGYVYTTGKPMAVDYCTAGKWWLRAAALDHPWAGYFLTQSALDSKFESCNFKLSPDDLRRFAGLASENITVSASEGRVEAMYVALQEREKE